MSAQTDLSTSAPHSAQTARPSWSREEIESAIGRGLKWVLIAFFVIVTVFPFYWMLNLSLRPEQDIITHPTRLIPTMQNIEDTLHPVWCWIRYGTDDPEENADLPENCVNTFGQSSYTIVLVRQGFPPYIWNSIVISVLTVSLTLILAIPASYAITRLRFRGKSLMSWGILLIYMFPAIVIAIPLFVIFTRLQLRGTLHGLIIVYLSGTLPVALYMLRSYFVTLPADLEEAALIDGCTYLSTIWRITIPLAIPAIASVALYTFMIAWNEFLYAFLFLVTTPDSWTLPLGLERLNDQEVPISALMAGSLIVSVPIIVIFFFFERFLTRGLTAGAVKG
jgi:multiple sugar transport system permease protein